jgi:hypothetical protein
MKESENPAEHDARARLNKMRSDMFKRLLQKFCNETGIPMGMVTGENVTWIRTKVAMPRVERRLDRNVPRGTPSESPEKKVEKSAE